ncbi:hypothetical protein KC19_4G154000 [Ceratodon purpureus]|uniref:Protein kinase domain-containing protein n=1 Tax=Ceratodon purpureus TaxID=3225 RepID=A0A8T0IB59_CERPU|nr:hypothetical protein KC19_4G154000 [Ceratodon purpureus]
MVFTKQHKWLDTRVGWCVVLFLVHFLAVGAQDPDTLPNTDGIPASPQEVIALLRFKHTLVDPRNVLVSWNESGVGACSGTWVGIKCAQGRIISIALSSKRLSGSIAPEIGNLVGLRKLNLHDNAITGAIPTALATITTLRGVALFNNLFTGTIPTGFGSLPLLQAFDVENNDLSGPIPSDLANAPGLNILNLSRNNLSGTIPAEYGAFQGAYLDLGFNNLTGPLPENWTAPRLTEFYVTNNNLTGSLPDGLGFVRTLKVLNVAQNDLSGAIPPSYGNLSALGTLDIRSNNLSGQFPPSFASLPLTGLNVTYNNLSGPIPAFATAFNISSYQPGNPGLCGFPTLLACPLLSPAPSPATPEGAASKGKKLSTLSIVFIALGSALGLILLIAVIIMLFCCCCRKRAAAGGAAGGDKPERSPEREADTGGRLVHFEGPLQFTADDLLCATAEVLGKSTYGTVYKATLENGSHIAVKRLREGIVKSQKDFTKEVDVLGKIRHPNLLSLRSYYWGPKDEKLLVYDYMPGGSLAAFLHARGPETALDWDTRIRIAEGAARGLIHLHQNESIVHGNLTASNILLDTRGPGITACISDFGLSRLMTPAANANVVATAGSLGYRAPELTKLKKATTKSDVYSFGIVLLELLTGKAPQDVSSTDGALDLPDYVASIVKENWTAEVFDVELMKGSNAPSEEELMTALQLAMRCVSPPPADRPEMDEIIRSLQELHPRERFQSPRTASEGTSA